MFTSTKQTIVSATIYDNNLTIHYSAILRRSYHNNLLHNDIKCRSILSYCLELLIGFDHEYVFIEMSCLTHAQN